MSPSRGAGDLQRPLLVGREREQSMLIRTLDSMLAGHGSLTLIGGEAGIGKTTLVEWFAQEAELWNCLVLNGACYDLTTTPAYGPWLEVLRSYPLHDQLPRLPGFVTDPEALASRESQETRFNQLVQFFSDVAERRPLLIVLDDLQWADQGSLDFLRIWSRSLARQRTLLLCTHRSDVESYPHPMHRLLPLLVREARAQRIALRPLDAPAITALVAARHFLTEPDAGRLIGWLVKRGEGNPFYLHELIRSLEEQEILTLSETGGWYLGDLDHAPVPSLVRNVIDQRLNRLDAQVRELLQVGAVIGHEVSVELWQRVTGAADSDLIATLRQGRAAHILNDITSGDSWHFNHALIRETLYEDLVAMQRRSWHRQVAESLVTLPNPDPDRVAYHFQNAGDSRSVEWLIRAGRRAREARANVTAIGRYKAALAAMDQARIGETEERAWLLVELAGAQYSAFPHNAIAVLDMAERIAAKVEDRALRVAVTYVFGEAHCCEADLGQGVAEMRRALNAFDALTPDEQRQVEKALGKSAERLHSFPVMFSVAIGHVRDTLQEISKRATTQPLRSYLWFLGLMQAHTMLGDPQPCEDLLLRASRETEVDAPEYSQVGLNYLLYLELVAVPFLTDQVKVCQRIAETGEAAWRKALDLSPSYQPPEIAWLPLLLIHGRWNELLHLMTTARRYNSSQRGVIDLVAAPFDRFRGDDDSAWKRVQETLPRGPRTEPGGTIYTVSLTLQRVAAGMSLDADNPSAARDWLKAHDRWLAWSGAALGRAEGSLLWAQYHRHNSDLEQARACAEAALAHASEPRQPLALVGVHRFLGQVDMEEKIFASAEGHLQHSLGLADACSAPFERALTLITLAELRLAQQNQAGAKNLLDEARAICESLRAMPTLDRIDTLLQHLATVRTPAAERPAGLTRREIEVLCYAAQGMTDPEIAERLSISPRTASTHMSSVFNKLGIGSRAAAAVWAKEQGLV